MCWSSDANTFHTFYLKVILIIVLNSKTGLLKKEDCQNERKIHQEKPKLSLSNHFEKMVNISLPELLIYAPRKRQLAGSMCALSMTTKAQWTEKEKTGIFRISFIKENKRKLEISRMYFVLANSW